MLTEERKQKPHAKQSKAHCKSDRGQALTMAALAKGQTRATLRNTKDALEVKVPLNPKDTH